VSPENDAERTGAFERGARHVAGLEARYESHLAAVRARAERLRESAGADADALARTLNPDDQNPE